MSPQTEGTKGRGGHMRKAWAQEERHFTFWEWRVSNFKKEGIRKKMLG